MTDRRRTPRVSRRNFLQASALTLTAPQALASLPIGPLVTEAAAGATTTIAAYLHTRLAQHGGTTLFGVPGATCDPFFAAAKDAGVDVVITSSDLEAGYAADGFARMKGLGVVSVTYGVGTMSLMTAIGGAFAERSPVVIVNGGPTPEDLKLQQEFGTLFSHSTGRPSSDLNMFRELTGFAERIENAASAPKVIDQAITFALTQQRPVYLEVPKNLWEAKCAAPTAPLDVTRTPSGKEAALAVELLEKLRGAAAPVLVLGIEVQRLGLEAQVTALVEKLGVPFVTTLLSKAVIDERTKGFAGVYGGDRAVPSVKQLVEGADVVVALGCVLGRQHRKLATQRQETFVLATNGTLRIGKKGATKCELSALVSELQRAEWQPNPKHLAGKTLTGLTFKERRASLPAVAAVKDGALTFDQLLESVSASLDESCIAMTDTSLSMYPAAELHTHGAKSFLSNSVWQAIGYSVAAAVGVAVAQPKRPVVLCGDGGFQMTAQSLSTMARRKLPAVVLVLDHGLYGIEQWLLEPRFFQDAATAPKPYLSLHRWDYVGLAKALGVSQAVMVDTKTKLDDALAKAKANTKEPSLLHVVLQPKDLPSQLKGGA
ncbi:MAG: alpha-keto acid decarboxylase family protein [Archangiaceae bacterium]|nr:alpha-keto acid decarboxylase family protein [Archangiaceae bacterium]